MEFSTTAPRNCLGRINFANFYEALHAQFRDFRFSPVVSLAEGNLVCLHWSRAFRQTASGTSLKVTGATVVRVENGVFAEAWQNWDAASLGVQLSVEAPAPLVIPPRAVLAARRTAH